MDSIYLSKFKAFHLAINKHGFQNIIILGVNNIRYLCGFYSNPAYLIVTVSGNYLTTEYRYNEQATYESHQGKIMYRV
ncbi:hypothetical protein PSECIP111951_01849 [Pseudoalteromonas holothuriae]|uniref:Creatinase N-terminal domain-containing protein n=1 Tax=Pseudoalteromonas holothuriae TaxID=2963714 RepID=A0ABM9GIB6_9GAMM|nr:hypothetical protein PSECIP111951_01849 [Pseudoalteromonas sp. CIP111951]